MNADHRSRQQAAELLTRLSASVLAEFNAVAEQLYALARQAGVPSSRVNDRLASSRERIASLIGEINRIAATDAAPAASDVARHAPNAPDGAKRDIATAI